MTDLMCVLYEYIVDNGMCDYLKLDSEYHKNSMNEESWMAQLTEDLGEKALERFEKCREAALKAQWQREKAIFCAAVDLCRELYGMVQG